MEVVGDGDAVPVSSVNGNSLSEEAAALGLSADNGGKKEASFQEDNHGAWSHYRNF